MKLIINKNQINTSPEQFLRQAGFGFIRDRRTGKESFVRRLGSGFYPRLHMYAREQGDKIVFDLHLDQKQASYQGSRMHNAEHDGEVVGAEIERLKFLVTHNAQRETQSDVDDNELKGIGHGELPTKVEEEEKKSWWRRLFS